MENLIVKVEGDQQHLEVRTGEAQILRDPQVLKLLDCAIDSPLRYLQKRVKQIDLLSCHLTVDRERLMLLLTINENSYFMDHIQGVLKLSPEYERMGVNSYDYVTPLVMSERIKMNRSLFENQTQAMELVTQLRQFRARIDKDIERNIDLNKGDKKLTVIQSVETNLPKKFNLFIPIFVGLPKQVVEVETYFNPDDLTCCLISPQANDIMQNIKDTEIDRQITEIITIAPELLIIEK